MKQETRHAVSGAEGTVACRDEVAVVERRKSKETTKSEQPTSSSLRQFTSRPAQLVLTAQNWVIGRIVCLYFGVWVGMTGETGCS